MESEKETKVVDLIADRKKAEIKAGFLNPFGEKTSYAEFQEAVKASKVSVAEYCKKHLTEDQIEFIEKELTILKDK